MKRAARKQHQPAIEHSSAVAEAPEMNSEAAGNYNPGVLHDDLIRVHLKALSFSTNRNGFLHKKISLEKTHKNAFGDLVPAYKSFERQLVNKNHIMKDSGSREDTAIGFIERSTLKTDGVYLDIVIWKRTLSDSEQSQIKSGRVFVSMECEYDKPVIISNGQEIAVDRAARPSANTVRSMADDSTVSFVGLAILFDGVQPGDPNSGVIFQENAALDMPCVEVNTEESTLTVDEDVDFVTKTDEETQMESANLLAELEALKATLETERTARELAEATAQQLMDAADAKATEVDAKSAELNDMYTKYSLAIQELQILKAKAFDAGVAEWFDVAALAPEMKEFLMGLCCSCDCNEDFEEVAAKIVAVAACLKKTPSAKVATDDATEGESATVNEESTEVVETPAGEGEIAAETPTVEVEIAIDVETGISIEDEQATGAPAQAPESATAELTPQVEAAPIAGSSNKKKTWGIEHL